MTPWKKRTTQKQFQIYITSAKENPFLITGKSDPKGTIHSTEIWDKLTTKLNDSDGPERLQKEWKKVFTDWKSATRKKARQGKELNHFEKDLLSYCGLDNKMEPCQGSANCSKIVEKEKESKKLVLKQEINQKDDSLDEENNTNGEPEEDDIFIESSYKIPQFEDLANYDKIGRLADSIMAVADAINRYCDVIEKQ